MAGGPWLRPEALGPPFQNVISEKDMKKCCPEKKSKGWTIVII